MLAFLAVSVMLAVRCHTAGDLPDHVCTPGAVQTTDLAVVCGTNTRGRRHVSERVRRQVMAAYGVPWEDRGFYELDHLVSLKLGGSNDAKNLWPEPLEEAKRKDHVENLLHRRVCDGQVRIEDAQQLIATDWTRGM